MNPSTRPMTTRRTRIGPRSYRFLPGLVRASGRLARAGAAFFADFFAATFTGCARLAVTRTFVAEAFFAGTALSLVVAGAAGFAFAGAGFTSTAFLAGAGATATTGLGAAGLAAAPGAPGLLLGRPPLRANWASANILANASFAS